MIKYSAKYILVIFLISLQACSLQKWKEPSAELKATLVNVSAAYLTGVMHNSRGTITGYSSLKDILQNNRLAEDKFFTRVKVLQNKFPAESHPLVGLNVVQVLQKENDARVVLHKADGSVKEPIVLELYWANSGWLVVKESITPDDGLVQKLTGV